MPSTASGLGTIVAGCVGNFWGGQGWLRQRLVSIQLNNCYKYYLAVGLLIALEFRLVNLGLINKNRELILIIISSMIPLWSTPINIPTRFCSSNWHRSSIASGFKFDQYLICIPKKKEKQKKYTINMDMYISLPRGTFQHNSTQVEFYIVGST